MAIRVIGRQEISDYIRNGRVDLSSYRLAVGQNETAELSHDHRANHWDTRTGVMMGLKRGGFPGLGKIQRENCKGVLGRESKCKREGSSELQACDGG
jgi:hypothetical protein